MIKKLKMRAKNLLPAAMALVAITTGAHAFWTPWDNLSYGNPYWTPQSYHYGNGWMPWNNYGYGGNNGIPWYGYNRGYSGNNWTPWPGYYDNYRAPWRRPWHNNWQRYPGWGGWNTGAPWGSGPGGWFVPNDPKGGMGRMWDDLINSPAEFGEMPGGWTAPTISVPNPIEVGDELERAARKAPGEAADQMDNFQFN